MKRAGDFGVEFLAPLLPVLLVEFGRALWDAYLKALAEKGGKALATGTVSEIKKLVRHTFSEKTESLSLDEAKKKMQEAGKKCGLSKTEIEKFVATIRSPEVVRALCSDASERK